MSSQAKNCARRLRVLADETRLAVMRELLKRGPCNVGELNRAIRIEQSLLSHHLRILRDAGLVLGERQGKAVTYSIAPGVESAAAGEGIDLGCCRLTFADHR